MGYYCPGHVSLLLRTGAEVNSPPADSRGYAALQEAMQFESSEIIEMLMEAGAGERLASSRGRVYCTSVRLQERPNQYISALTCAWGKCQRPNRSVTWSNMPREAVAYYCKWS